MKNGEMREPLGVPPAHEPVRTTHDFSLQTGEWLTTVTNTDPNTAKGEVAYITTEQFFPINGPQRGQRKVTRFNSVPLE